MACSVTITQILQTVNGTQQEENLHEDDFHCFHLPCSMVIAETERKTISLLALVFLTPRHVSPRRPSMKITTQVRNASWLSVAL